MKGTKEPRCACGVGAWGVRWRNLRIETEPRMHCASSLSLASFPSMVYLSLCVCVCVFNVALALALTLTLTVSLLVHSALICI